MIKSNWKYLFLAFILFMTDFLSKYFVINNMVLNKKESITVIDNFFYLSYVHNYGAAFSFLGDLGGIQIWLFSIVAVCIVSYLTREILFKNDSLFLKIGYAMVIAGALGNLYDRVFYGYVVDFLDIYIFGFDFAVFNVADVYICIGFSLIILKEIFKNEKSN